MDSRMLLADLQVKRAIEMLLLSYYADHPKMEFTSKAMLDALERHYPNCDGDIVDNPTGIKLWVEEEIKLTSSLREMYSKFVSMGVRCGVFNEYDVYSILPIKDQCNGLLETISNPLNYVGVRGLALSKMWSMIFGCETTLEFFWHNGMLKQKFPEATGKRFIDAGKDLLDIMNLYKKSILSCILEEGLNGS